MSAPGHEHHVEDAITRAAYGERSYSVRHYLRPTFDSKQQTIAEKEVEAGEDERDIRRKQACILPSRWHCVRITNTILL